MRKIQNGITWKKLKSLAEKTKHPGIETLVASLKKTLFASRMHINMRELGSLQHVFVSYIRDKERYAKKFVFHLK